MLSIQTNQNRDERFLELSLKGALDGATARQFHVFFQELLAKGCSFFLIDLSLLEYLSSVGIAELLHLSENLQERSGRLAIYGLNYELDLLFRFFSLDRRLSIFESQKEACDYLLTELRKRPAEVESNYASFWRRSQKQPQNAGKVSKQKELPEVQARPTYSEEAQFVYFAEKNIEENKEKKEVLKKTSVPASSESSREVPSCTEDENLNFFTGKFLDKASLASARKKYFRKPLLGSCRACALSLRFYHSGAHLCPGCGEKNFVTPDGRLENQEWQKE